MNQMKNEIEFHWPEIGTLEIAGSGLNTISLRYMPDLRIIAKELAKHCKTARSEACGERGQVTHKEP